MKSSYERSLGMPHQFHEHGLLLRCHGFGTVLIVHGQRAMGHVGVIFLQGCRARPKRLGHLPADDADDCPVKHELGT